MTEPLGFGAKRMETGCEREVAFPPEADFFDGHFDGAPVLPGVVQTGAAVRELERLLGRPVRVREVRKLKFARIVRPGDRVKVVLSRKADGEWAFRWEMDGEMCSSGVLVV